VLTDDWLLLWETPGGGCEHDKTIMEATAQELFEESGLVARSIDVLLHKREFLKEPPREDVPLKWKVLSFLVGIEAGEGEI
jgi:8-oxo-dGTP pyrophosphatase MutT (NUDIX family)